MRPLEQSTGLGASSSGESTSFKSLTGTHDGPFGDIEPTGKKINISGQLIMRFEGPRVAEEWESFDEVGMLKQIGVMPE